MDPGIILRFWILKTVKYKTDLSLLSSTETFCTVFPFFPCVKLFLIRSKKDPVFLSRLAIRQVYGAQGKILACKNHFLNHYFSLSLNFQ